MSTTEAVRRALAARPLPARGQRVTIAAPDITRPLDPNTTLGPLLEHLSDQGHTVTILIALGLHRPMTAAELAPVQAIADRHGARLLQHTPHDPDALVTLSPDVGLRAPHTTGALPSIVHAEIARADHLICLGTVEPHQYAGFSGGIKTIAIGCAGAATIGAMHGLHYLRDPRTGVGTLQENPFQEALWRVVAPLQPDTRVWALQVVPGPDTPCLHATFGPAREAFVEATTTAAQHLFQPLPAPVPWMRLRVPPSKAQSFYQASRAATYAALVRPCALQEGGWLLIDAACPEGVGLGAGEEACARAMLRGADALLAELHNPRYTENTEGPGGGQQRAYVIARALQSARIATLGAPLMPELAAMGIPQLASFDEAVEALGLGVEDGLDVTDPFHAVPVASPPPR